RDGVEEEFTNAAVSALHVVRPHDRPDARGAIGERYEPQPAVLEPVNGDQAGAFGLSVALRPSEVGVHRRTVVLWIAALRFEPAAEERVAAGSVHHELRMPRLRAPVLVLAGYEGAGVLRQELDISHPAALDHVRALVLRASEQDLVELRAPDLVGIRHRLVPA